MKATSDTLKIGHGIRDDRGEKLEPEEQPVDRVIGTSLPVTLGNAPGQGTPMDVVMRGSVTAETTAGEVVDDFARQCHLCVNWDPETYRRERTSYAPEELDEQRASVLELASAEELNLFNRGQADAILDACLGRCRALSHLSPDGRLDSHARAGCPAADPNGNPIRSQFKARHDARRATVAIRDRILRTAAGKE